ncbi:DMT family transporter [Ancylobacter sp. A5.8]|uniref:DMT family transporter n=1 Tax=Ancylobacter gelatini TaxID=2919920 RepID=UPI001F4D4CEC|nr:DMT family transporter [Ancylobacter gelatini]MCJ8144254.1 DMT family transporter [Ancylobacter gelatini]
MDLTVFLVVLASAVMQAGWNVALKLRVDPLQALVLVVVGAGIAAAPFALWFGPPDAAVLPLIAASVACHMAYYGCLAGAYARAELGLAYPVARGSALLMTAAVAILVLHEPIGVLGVVGIALLAASIVVLARRSLGRVLEGQALLLAMGSGVAITGYTLIDGTAARLAGSANAYTTWLFVCDAVLVGALVLASPRRRAAVMAPGMFSLALWGGTLLFVSYWLSIWAMTRAPIGLVTAVRESSVLVGALMAVVVLHEKLHAERIVAAFLVVGGLALIKLH